jgi:hypothetical protein
MARVESASLPERFFAATSKAFDQAEESVGLRVTRDYRIGGFLIRLHFAGCALVPAVTRALAHLAVPIPTSEPNLTINVWDSVSTRSVMPPPPWSSSDYLARGEIRGYNVGGMRVAFDICAGLLESLDSERRLGFYWIRDARQLPEYESGAPILTLFHWWLRAQGLQLVHAAAIGTRSGGVLLAGAGGSGKSTTALACLDAGMAYASDDYCLLETMPEPYAHSLYNTGKLDPDSLARLPQFGSFIENPNWKHGNKALLFLNEHFPGQVVPGFPLRAVLLPKVTGRDRTSLRLASPAVALRALAPSTIFQLGADGSALQTMAELIRRVPCYQLDLGTHMAQIPPLIKQLC